MGRGVEKIAAVAEGSLLGNKIQYLAGCHLQTRLEVKTCGENATPKQV